jgi:tRNA 2-thiouridine synthesizing protein A
MNVTINKYLDASGLLCPEPVMMLHRVVREAVVGDVIEVITTDPSTLRDIPKFCHFLGHELLEQTQTEKSFSFYIKKN